VIFLSLQADPKIEIFVLLRWVEIQVEVVWVVTPCSVVVGYRCCLHHPEDGGTMDLRNVGIISQHYTALQSRTPRHENSWIVISHKSLSGYRT